MIAPVRVLVAEAPGRRRENVLAALGQDPLLHVVKVVGDGRLVAATVERLRPSIVLMAVELPGLDGVTATEQVMSRCPTPVVLVLAEDRTATAVVPKPGWALAVVAPPPAPTDCGFAETAAELTWRLRSLAGVRTIRRRSSAGGHQTAALAMVKGWIDLVVAAASTGGPPALARFLGALPPDLAVPVVVVQHIAPGFASGLVTTLGRESPLPVRLAVGDRPPAPGVVTVAPDACDLSIGHGGVLALEQTVQRGAHPSADVLFTSAAAQCGARVAAVVLTGMGSDGLAGARAVREAGGVVLAQDEETSSVFGMPKAVTDAGLAHMVGPVEVLAREITRLSKGET